MNITITTQSLITAVDDATAVRMTAFLSPVGKRRTVHCGLQGTAQRQAVQGFASAHVNGGMGTRKYAVPVCGD